MVPPSSHGVSRVPRYFGYSSLTFSFAYVTLTLFGTFSHTFQLEIINTKCCPKPHKYCYLWFSLFRFRSPLLTESRLISLPRPTQMFQFRRFPSYTYLIQYMMLYLLYSGLLHSDICGSILACNSPQLFAAYHVLHRLPMPRHSPCALSSLTIFFKQSLYARFLMRLKISFVVFFLTSQPTFVVCFRKIFYFFVFLMHFYFALFSFQGSNLTALRSLS